MKTSGECARLSAIRSRSKTYASGRTRLRGPDIPPPSRRGRGRRISYGPRRFPASPAESILLEGQPSGLPVLEDLSSISAPDLEVPTLSTSLDAVLVQRHIGYWKCEGVGGVASDVSHGSPRKRQDTVTVAQAVFVRGGIGNLASLRQTVRRTTILWRSMRTGVTLLRSRRSSGRLSTACSCLCFRRPGQGRFCHGPRAKKHVGACNQREQKNQQAGRPSSRPAWLLPLPVGSLPAVAFHASQL